MNPKLVEEVARAIYEKNPLYGHRPNLGEAVTRLSWDDVSEHQPDYREQAQAAIRVCDAWIKREGGVT